MESIIFMIAFSKRKGQIIVLILAESPAASNILKFLVVIVIFFVIFDVVVWNFLVKFVARHRRINFLNGWQVGLPHLITIEYLRLAHLLYAFRNWIGRAAIIFGTLVHRLDLFDTLVYAVFYRVLSLIGYKRKAFAFVNIWVLIVVNLFASFHLQFIIIHYKYEI